MTSGLYPGFDKAALRNTSQGELKQPDKPEDDDEDPRDVPLDDTCVVIITPRETKLCLDEVGQATIVTDPADLVSITWSFPSGGLTLVGPNGAKLVNYRATKPGEHKVKCTIDTGPEQCSSEVTVVVPDAGLALGDLTPVKCVGISGHAPAIAIAGPVGEYTSATTALTKISGTNRANYTAAYQVAGKLHDPLGFDGVMLRVENIEGLSAPNLVPVGNDGSFAFQGQIHGFGNKRLVLRAQGLTHATGVAVLAGFVKTDPALSAKKRPLLQQREALIKAHKQVVEAQFKGANGQAPDFTQQALNPLEAALQAQLDTIVNQIKQIDDRRDSEAVIQWQAGGNDGYPTLTDNSRYRLVIIDKDASPPEQCDILSQTFEVDGFGDTLISVDPEAFVPLSQGHDGKPVASRQSDIILEVTPAVEEEFLQAVYRNCHIPVCAPYRISVSGEAFALLSLPQANRMQQLGDRNPAGTAGGAAGTGGSGVAIALDLDERLETRVRKRPAQLKAEVKGACTDRRKFLWRAAYGPDPSTVELETQGPRDEVCLFSAEVPGIYLIEVGLETDHINPLAVAVYEVEVVDVAFELMHPPTLLLDTNEHVITVDDGPDFRVDAILGLRSDAGLPSVNAVDATYKIQWAGSDARGAVTPAPGTQDFYAYQIGQRADTQLYVSAFLTEITLTHRDGEDYVYDVSTISMETTLPTVYVQPGKPDRVSVQVLKRNELEASVPLQRMSPYDINEQGKHDSVQDIRESATGLRPFDIGSEHNATIVVTAKDTYDNPVASLTEVGFDSLSAGLILPPGQRIPNKGFPFQFDDAGKVRADLKIPEKMLDRVLVKITVGEQEYYLGNPVAGLKFQPTAHQTTEVGSDGIKIKELSGAARVHFQVQDTNGVPLQARFKVHARMSAGSLSFAQGEPWRSDHEEMTNRQGQFTIFFNPAPHNPDGSENYTARKAWGDAQLTLAVGAGREQLKVHFDSVASIRRTPKIVLPNMNIVSQADQTWIENGDPNIAPTIQGEPGREVIVELIEDLEYKEIARFDFNTPATGLWHPVEINTARLPSSYRPAEPVELKSRDSGSASAFGHVRIDDAMPSSPDGGNALRVQYSLLAQTNPIRYGATLPSALGFKLATWIRVDDDVPEWTALHLRGSDANGQVTDAAGFLKISFMDRALRPSVIVEYRASGCPTRPTSSIIPVVRRVNRNQWVHVSISVLPSLGENKVQANIDVDGHAIERTGSGFNFLSGDTFHLDVPIPDDGVGHLDHIQYSIPMSRSLHLDNGFGHSPWSMHVLQSNEMSSPLINQPDTERSDATFTEPLQRYAKLTVAYCDVPEFERVDISAADQQAANASLYLKDVIASFVIGDSQSAPGMGADFAAAMVGWGDLRDIAKNLAYAWPGGRDPNWTEFGLAVAGLALDVATIFSGGGAAPGNAVLAAIKVMLKRLEPFAQLFPQAKFLAGQLAELAQVVLIRMRGRRVAQGATFSLTLEEIKQFVPGGLIDYLFEDITAQDLEAFASFAKDITPAFNPLAPINAVQALANFDQLNESDERIRRMKEVVQLIQSRIATLSWFFNPQVANVQMLDSVAELFTQIRNLPLLQGINAADIQTRLDALLDGSVTWVVSDKLARNSSDARHFVTAAAERMGAFLAADGTRIIEGLDHKAMRGFVSFIAASGPMKGFKLLENIWELAGARGDVEELKRILYLLDDTAEIISSFDDVANNPALLRTTLNKLWGPMATRKFNTAADPLGGAIMRSATNGALTEMETVRAYRYLLDAASGINPVDGQGLQLQDFLGLVNAIKKIGIEVKSFTAARPTDVNRRIDQIVAQFRRLDRYMRDLVPPANRIPDEMKFDTLKLVIDTGRHLTPGISPQEKLRMLQEALEVQQRWIQKLNPNDKIIDFVIEEDLAIRHFTS